MLKENKGKIGDVELPQRLIMRRLHPIGCHLPRAKP